VVQDGVSTGWGKLLNLPENKHREGLGFAPSNRAFSSRPDGNAFCSAGFIHAPSKANDIIENPERVTHNFMT